MTPSSCRKPSRCSVRHESGCGPSRSWGTDRTSGGLGDALPSLVVRAAQKLTSEEKPEYNPLYVWGSDAEGAVQLLAAAGRTFRAREPNAVVGMISAAEFAEDYIRALSAGVAGVWRERWWSVDLLLVRDVQALSDTERAQDEFFHLFEALERRNARILLTADRAPSGIKGIDTRLSSRFKGGLVLENEGRVEPPPPPPPTAPQPVAQAAPPEQAPRAVTSTATGARWNPSAEKVVWRWPVLEDRIVEDAD